MAKNKFDVRIKVIGCINTEVGAKDLEEARRMNEDSVKNVFTGKLQDVTWEEREKPQQLSDSNYRFYMRATGYLDITVSADNYDEASLEVDYMMYDIEMGHNDMVGHLTSIGWNKHQWLGRH